MSNIVEADYTIVQERTLPVIIGEIKIIEQNTARIVLENGIQIGQRLQEAKEKVGHGNFGDWCKENLNYSQDTAQKFMKLAKEYGDDSSFLANTATSRNFSISNALSLLKLPEEDREKFVEEHPVEDMTNKALEDEIRKLKEEKESQEAKVGQLLDEKEDMASQIATMEARMQSLEQQLAVASTEPQVDQAEVEELKAKLEKEKQKTKKAKEELKKEQESRQAAIDQTIGNQKQAMEQEIRKEVEEELKEAKQSIGNLLEQVDQLERRAANAGDEKKVQFKIHMDQLQDNFGKALYCIFEEEDPKMQKKMMTAMNMVLDKLSKEARI